MSAAVRTADAREADTATEVFLASRAAAMPWLADLHTDAGTRHFVEHRVLATVTA